MPTKFESFIKKQAGGNTQKLYSEIIKHCIKRIMRKNQVIRCVDIKEIFFFVESGCLRQYFIRPDGEEVTIDIACEGECIIMPTATFNSHTYVEAIVRSELIAISSLPSIWDIGLNFICFMLSLIKDQRYITQKIIQMNAHEKYVWLLKFKSRVIQFVPGKIIASYLGISPSTLSRIRSKERSF